MALINCKQCKHQYSTDFFPKCPNCGRKRGMSAAKRFFLGTLALIIFVKIVSAGGRGANTMSVAAAPADELPTAGARVESPAPLPVSASALWKAYDSNEVSADDLYKGRLLLITGIVASIDKDFADNIVLQLASGQMFQSVHAKLHDSQKSSAASLTKNQRVAVLCKGSGRIIGSPMLTDCILQ